MSSGQYSALSGAISRMDLLATITDNMANTGTAGFKKGRAVFESELRQSVADRQTRGINFNRLQDGFTDFSQGTLVKTGSPLQMGIQGEGYFKLQGPDKQVLYTRQGSFLLGAGGRLQTIDGYAVVGDDGRPITLSRPDVEIEEDGLIKDPNGETKIIPLFSFGDEAKLVRQGDSRFSALKGADPKRVDEPHIYQGELEQANVNVMEEMTHMVDALRSFESLQKALATYNEIDKKTIEVGVVG